MRLFRAVSAFALAGVLALSAAPAGAAPAPAVTAGQRASETPIAPWGSAHFNLSDETKTWMTDNGVTRGAIAPFVLDADGLGVEMPLGANTEDHVDDQGRIFYPGGIPEPDLHRDLYRTAADLDAHLPGVGRAPGRTRQAPLQVPATRSSPSAGVRCSGGRPGRPRGAGGSRAPRVSSPPPRPAGRPSPRRPRARR